MHDSRSFSTRELAQMWNVSESTVKRWANTGELSCFLTPGGHRRFRLKDIWTFQNKRRFEATGVLAGVDWNDPDIELCLNSKNFERVRKEITYLALQNHRTQIRELFERLHLRGISLVEMYDEILIPVHDEIVNKLMQREMSVGHARLLSNNLEEALYLFFPQIIRRQRNGKMGLCAAVDAFCRMPVNAVSRILETEGWEALNLGTRVPFDAMAEMVRKEPVNLVCVACFGAEGKRTSEEPFEILRATAEEFRIPLVLVSSEFSEPELRIEIRHEDWVTSFKALRTYVNRVRD